MERLLHKTVVITALVAVPCTLSAQQEIGHYTAGVMNIRDYAMPDSGFYGALYNYWYASTRVNDNDGNEIDLVGIGPNGGATLDVDLDLNVYAFAPTFIWVAKKKVLGAKYGAIISPVLCNQSVGAALSTLTGPGRSGEVSGVGLADLFVQPLWLDWKKEHWDIALGYAFYAPVGKYAVETVTLPNLGEFKAEAADNIGFGFWTHQLQFAPTWYPWADRRMAVVPAVTYELHGKKKDFDLKPGADLSFNLGVSQYLPLNTDMTCLLELGPMAYGTWQVSEDTGLNGAEPLEDDVQAVGFQAGITKVDWNAVFNLRYLYEFAAVNRFQGQVVGLNLAVKF